MIIWSTSGSTGARLTQRAYRADIDRFRAVVGKPEPVTVSRVTRLVANCHAAGRRDLGKPPTHHRLQRSPRRCSPNACGPFACRLIEVIEEANHPLRGRSFLA